MDASFDPGEGAIGISCLALQPDWQITDRREFHLRERRGPTRHCPAPVERECGTGSFNIVTVIGAYEVDAVALQSDGKVLFGGWFTKINGPTRNSIARFNADGSLDAAFNPGTGTDGRVRCIALQPDGNVLISGQFNA